MTQLTLQFDAAKSDAAKTRGMAIAAADNEVLAKAQEVALWLGRHGKAISADDVYHSLVILGIKPSQLGPAAGSIFKGQGWKCVGWVKSTRVSNHARMIRSWVKA